MIKKNHTEFCKTLDISLQCNMNHSQALKRLSLSRTAYLYRMKRIREITGYDLNDFKTRLYLMDLFQLIGCHNVEI
ncbi:MAG: PucR family transcriptional regulator [Lachnospiraceae bacterium]|jgi:purine catabolism regulator|nr:PucR family transcriptional regulator [Lachnospiraceae bacterium]